MRMEIRSSEQQLSPVHANVAEIGSGFASQHHDLSSNFELESHRLSLESVRAQLSIGEESLSAEAEGK